jgi:hypothetical protein
VQSGLGSYAKLTFCSTYVTLEVCDIALQEMRYEIDEVQKYVLDFYSKNISFYNDET